MTDNFMREFANECVAFNDAMKLYDRTMIIYNFLKDECTEPLSPTEIAQRLEEKSKNEMFTFKHYWYKEDIVHPLYWLLGMGLVDRESYDTTIHIDSYSHYEIDRKWIDGQMYVAKNLVKGGFDKKVTMYKWFAK